MSDESYPTDLKASSSIPSHPEPPKDMSDISESYPTDSIASPSSILSNPSEPQPPKENPSNPEPPKQNNHHAFSCFGFNEPGPSNRHKVRLQEHNDIETGRRGPADDEGNRPRNEENREEKGGFLRFCWGGKQNPDALEKPKPGINNGDNGGGDNGGGHNGGDNGGSNNGANSNNGSNGGGNSGGGNNGGGNSGGGNNGGGNSGGGNSGGGNNGGGNNGGNNGGGNMGSNNGGGGNNGGNAGANVQGEQLKLKTLRIMIYSFFVCSTAVMMGIWTGTRTPNLAVVIANGVVFILSVALVIALEMFSISKDIMNPLILALGVAIIALGIIITIAEAKLCKGDDVPVLAPAPAHAPIFPPRQY